VNADEQGVVPKVSYLEGKKLKVHLTYLRYSLNYKEGSESCQR
jgi:hypothetical protein